MYRLEMSRLEMFELEMSILEMSRLEMSIIIGNVKIVNTKIGRMEWPFSATVVHYQLVRLLSPSSLEVKSDGRRAKSTSLDRLRIYSRPVTDEDHVCQTCVGVRGPKP